MNASTARDSLAQLSGSVAARMGLHFPPERWADLERGIRAATPELGFKDAEECLRELSSAPLSDRQVETLARHLTIGETYFWREKQSLEVLEQHILPRLIEARRNRAPDQRTLRIWSAGCCTGEEPYSIAMLLSNLIPDRRNWNLTVLATDINSHFLKRAEAGTYREWSFRGAPPWLKERYFRETVDGHYQVVPHIREMVSFSYLNLVEDTYPSILNDTHAMDVILCRNVLIYLTAESTRKITQNFHRSLVDGGWLIVSPSEVSQTLLSQFSTVNFPGAILYQKERKPRIRHSGSPRADMHALQPAAPHIPPPQPPFIDVPVKDVGVPAAPEPQVPVVAGRQMTPPQAGSTPGGETSGEEAYRDALTLYEQGRYAMAVERLAGLSLNGATPAPVLILLARAHANSGHLAEALEYCERVITQDKMNPVGHYLHAMILQEQGAVGAAVAALKRALYLDHDFVMAHFALGNLSRQQGKIKEARKHFENALALLHAYRSEDVLTESEGLTAGGMAAIMASLTQSEKSP